MKFQHIFIGALHALAAVTLASCEDNFMLDKGMYPSLQNNYLSVAPDALSFSSDAVNQSIQIRTLDAGWRISGLPEWLETDVEEGTGYKEVYVQASVNNRPVSREAIVDVTASGEGWTLTKNVVVSQSQGRASIQLATSNLTASGAAHSETVDVETNLTDIELASTQTWLTAAYDKANSVIILTFEENQSTYSRSATITASSMDNSASASMYVTQSPPSVHVDDTSTLTVDVDGGTYARSITSESSWKAVSGESWIDVTPSEGAAGVHTLNISVTPNHDTSSRSGYVYLYVSETSSYKSRIYVSQPGRYISHTPQQLHLAYDGSCDDAMTVSSNVAWEVQRKPEWLTMKPSSGVAGKTVVTLSADPLASLVQRSGQVVLASVPGGSVTHSFDVLQRPISIDEEAGMEFDWHASSQTYRLPFPGQWSASVSDGWLSLSEYSGTGETDLLVTVTENELQQPRTATVAFISEGKTFSMSVLQQAQYLYIDGTGGEISARGGSVELTVKSSLGALTSVEYEGASTGWLDVTDDGNGVYMLVAEANPSIHERTATFVIKPSDPGAADKYQQGVRFVLKQFGRRMSADTSAIEMHAKGGTSAVYTVSADGDYTMAAADADTWYTFVPNYSNNTFYIVCSENKTHGDRKGHIRLSLSGLPAGETFEIDIPVTQYRLGVQLDFKDYDDDIKW